MRIDSIFTAKTYKMLNLLATFLMPFIISSGLISSALSHTWVEQICLLTSHEIGYPRGNGATSDHFMILKFAEHSL